MVAPSSNAHIQDTHIHGIQRNTRTDCRRGGRPCRTCCPHPWPGGGTRTGGAAAGTRCCECVLCYASNVCVPGCRPRQQKHWQWAAAAWASVVCDFHTPLHLTDRGSRPGSTLGPSLSPGASGMAAWPGWLNLCGVCINVGDGGGSGDDLPWLCGCDLWCALRSKSSMGRNRQHLESVWGGKKAIDRSRKAFDGRPSIFHKEIRQGASQTMSLSKQSIGRSVDRFRCLDRFRCMVSGCPKEGTRQGEEQSMATHCNLTQRTRRQAEEGGGRSVQSCPQAISSQSGHLAAAVIERGDCVD